MDILEKTLSMLVRYPLCDTCLGRQFALLGHGIENSQRGRALKLSLTLQASALTQSKNKEGLAILKTVAQNGFSREAEETVHHLKKRIPQKEITSCYLCEGKFQLLEDLVERVLAEIVEFQFTSFLVGIELPVKVEEREDEFKAEFNVSYGENIRHEFGRLLGKRIEEKTAAAFDYKRPDIAIIINPFSKAVRIQVNPLFVAGRYRKLVRNIPQSKWFCSSCRGKGCEKCEGTGKLYPESVEELVSQPFMDAAIGEKTAFHASGREDIDARMLGNGRPFVVEVSKPKKRFLNLKELRQVVNDRGKGKVEVSNLRFSNKSLVRKLKKAECAQKEYRVIIEFEDDFLEEDLNSLEEKLSNVQIKQRTPLRVMHRRADLIRERYIYKVKVKRLSLNRAELEIRCQGGLYVKELVSGDEGRTSPSISELLNNKAKPIKLDVLKVIIEDQ